MVDFTHLTPALQSVFTIEVKSSTNYTITSLQKFIKKFSRQLATPPIVVHYQD